MAGTESVSSTARREGAVDNPGCGCRLGVPQTSAANAPNPTPRILCVDPCVCSLWEPDRWSCVNRALCAARPAGAGPPPHTKEGPAAPRTHCATVTPP